MRSFVETLQAALGESYYLERELGHGGMAIVYLARDIRHNRFVALKTLRPELLPALGAERFLREIQIAAQLHHPNILALYDSGETQGLLYYVMPYVDDESLRTRLERESQLSVEHALHIASQVADALAYAHAQGVIHRDIKPENILLNGEHALVADFGIARALTAAGGERLTETGLVVGTATYMSPEQATADPRLDGRTDIYSLACVAYEMLGGQPPFTGPSAQAIVARHTLDPVPSLRTLRKAVPEATEQALLKALEKNPADRFRTASEFADALKHPDGILSARRSGSTVRVFQSKEWRAVGAASLVVAVLGTSWMVTGARAHEGRKSVAVLPCDNMSRDTSLQYLSDRWSEELIDKLSRISELRPKSWLSMRRFRDTQKSSREIAQEVGAGTLVRCSVAETHDSLFLRVQAIGANEDDVLWSQEFRRLLSPESINAVQMEAAQQIAGKIGVAPSATEQERLEKVPTHDLAALQAYRLGRQFLGEVHVEKSISEFQSALARDSLFAAAYVGLADASLIHGQQDGRPPREYVPRSIQMILKALEIDPSLADAHTLLADYLLMFNHDWPSAETEYRRALQLDPNSTIVHMWYGLGLAIVGHADKAVAQLRKAVELDPAFPLAHIQLASGLRVARHYEEALQHINAALRISPNNPVAYLHLGLIRLQQGLADSAVAAFEKGVQVGATWVDARSRLANAYGFAHQREKATAILNELLQAQHPEPLQVARVYAGLDDRPQAMAWLRRAYQESSFEVLIALGGQDPAFHRLRTEPGFQALRKQAGMDTW